MCNAEGFCFIMSVLETHIQIHSLITALVQTWDARIPIQVLCTGDEPSTRRICADTTTPIGVAYVQIRQFC